MSYKICVVGAGYWGKNHIRTLHELGALGGIVDSDERSLELSLRKYEGSNGYLNIDEALIGDYDGYTIATPAETHYELAKKVILAKKHVMIEKPMTLSISDSEELIRLAENNNVNLMVGHVLLFHPAINKVKELIDIGRIGELQYIYSNRLNLGKVRTEENVFWSLAPHDIAIFQYLTNSKPKNIYAKGSTFLQSGIPDSTLTHIEYENKVKGHIFVSWLHPFKEHRLVVIGSEAMITFEDSKEGKPLKLYSKKFDLISGVPEKVDGPVEWISYEKQFPLTVELKYFLDHLNGDKLEIADMYQGLDVVKILVEASEQIMSK